MPILVLRALPYVVMVVGLMAFMALLRFSWGPGLRVRPVLLAGLVLAWAAALYVGLTWAGLVRDDYLRIARPWVLVLGLGAMAFITVRLLSHTVRQGRGRTHLGDALITAATLGAAMAAAGLEIGRPLDRLTILIAMDRSRSIDLVPHADKRLTQEVSVAEIGMRDDDRIATIAFAADAATEDPPRPRSNLPPPQRVVVGRDGTDLAAAIRRALAEVPADTAARIVLLTDGVATRGDTMAAAAAAVAAQIPVDVVPLEQRLVPDVRVVALRAPARADEGEAMDLRLVTSSPAAAEIEIRIKRDGQLISAATAKIAAGEDVLRIREKAPAPGLHRYDVEITAKDPRLDEAPEDNSGSTFVRVRGQAAALVIDGDPGKTRFIAKALEDSAFRVEEGGAVALPGDLGGLALYDLVVLGDVPAHALSPAQIDVLASYVRDFGGGLILMGGDRSMGPGGYSRTPLEEVSPVSFDLKQERRRASLAEVIGIDISGSMGAEVGGHTKLELANEAAARSAALLGPGDMLGVEHVDTVVNWSVPLGPVVDKAAIDKAIRAVKVGGGGILVDITLVDAYAALDKQKVNLKHVLLFADGADAEQMGGCRAMVSHALQRKITTSVIALGNGSDVPELEVLSKLGDGRFYLIEDAARLPSVFAQETILAARSAVVEKDFNVSLGVPGAITAGIAFEQAPILKGYVVTIPKSRATVLLTGPDSDPILAVWSAGIGRSAAFTSDLKDRWGGAWTQWPGAARLIAQVARDVSRKAEDARVRVEADTSGGELHLRANVVGDDGRTQSFRRLTAHVAGPDGFARDVVLEASGAGAYSATVPLSRPGTYIAVARDELTGEALGTAGAALTAGEELRPTGSDLALLSRIAELTGGKKRDTLAGIYGDRASRRFSYEDITPTLLLLGALALLLAVAARRLAVPDVVLAAPLRIKQWWGGRIAASAAAPHPSAVGSPEPEATMSSLLHAKDRGWAERGMPGARPAPGEPPPPTFSGPARSPPPYLGGMGAPVGDAPAHLRAPPVATHAGPARAAPPNAGPAFAPPPMGARQVNRDGAAPPSQGRHLTAAEILLARRRGKG